MKNLLRGLFQKRDSRGAGRLRYLHGIVLSCRFLADDMAIISIDAGNGTKYSLAAKRCGVSGPTTIGRKYLVLYMVYEKARTNLSTCLKPFRSRASGIFL